jgi:hypothetical protein
LSLVAHHAHGNTRPECLENAAVEVKFH